ncbi:hypothetical protein HK102_007904 [Quaeritorhiza haematococci]|nr:hypothetical protein HK102_007904 [Quaeritorhiza haematococci]
MSGNTTGSTSSGSGSSSSSTQPPLPPPPPPSPPPALPAPPAPLGPTGRTAATGTQAGTGGLGLVWVKLELNNNNNNPLLLLLFLLCANEGLVGGAAPAGRCAAPAGIHAGAGGRAGGSSDGSLVRLPDALGPNQLVAFMESLRAVERAAQELNERYSAVGTPSLGSRSPGSASPGSPNFNRQVEREKALIRNYKLQVQRFAGNNFIPFNMKVEQEIQLQITLGIFDTAVDIFKYLREEHMPAIYLQWFRNDMHRFVALGDRAWSTAWKEFCAAHLPNLNPLDFREHLLERVKDSQHTFTTFVESQLARVLDLAYSADATRGVSRLDNLELKLDKVRSLVADNKNPARNPRRESHPLDADPYNDYEPMEAYNVAPAAEPSTAPPSTSNPRVSSLR